jgi:hypothetical protein
VDSALDSLDKPGPASEADALAPPVDLELRPIADAEEPAGTQPGALPAKGTAPVVEPVAFRLDSVSPVLSPALEPSGLTGPTLLTLAPVTGEVASPLGPVADPLASALVPITAPLGAVLVPVTGPLGTVLAPLTAPLAPVLVPMVDPLAPVLATVIGPLAPVLAPVAVPLNSAIMPSAPVIPTAQPPITGPAVPPPSPGEPNTPAKRAKPSEKPGALWMSDAYLPDSNAVPAGSRPRECRNNLSAGTCSSMSLALSQ